MPRPTGPYDAADIERICARLSLYSVPLAQSFQEALLRGECGPDPWRFADEMEKGFFREYFGEDPDVQAFARLLLLGSRTGAALTLNQLVAGGISAPVTDIRSVLTMVLDQHFPNEALFTEWLKVKFGVIAVDVPPPAEAAPAAEGTAVAAAAIAPAPDARSDSTSGVLRPMAVIFMWAVALYFVLFAALPMVQ